MGITGLATWLIEKCPSAFKKRSDAPDALFVDLPALTYSLYSQEDCLKDGVATPKFYETVISKALEIVQKINPSRLVYLGKDGVEMPAKERAKVERADRQDRQVKDVRMYFPDTDESFDRNMRAEIERRREKGDWKDLVVVYDPGEAPMESEQKFRDYLRRDQNAKNMKWVICSNDSDFVVLTLPLVEVSDLWIYSRNDKDDSTKDEEEHTIKDEKELNIGYLRREIAHRLGCSDGGDRAQEYLNDFVFLMSMTKNDFLPGIAQIDELITAYTETSQQLVTGGRIDRGALKELWKNLNLRLDSRPIVRINARQNRMAESYIHGLYWFRNMYLGDCADWGWNYPFKGRPPVQALITCLDAVAEPKPKLAVVPMKVHHRLAVTKATNGQFLEAFRRVYRNSLDNILARGDIPRMTEIKAHVLTNEAAKDALAAIVQEPIGRDVPATPGLLWIYNPGQEEKREILIPPAAPAAAAPPPVKKQFTTWQQLRLKLKCQNKERAGPFRIRPTWL